MEKARNSGTCKVLFLPFEKKELVGLLAGEMSPVVYTLPAIWLMLTEEWSCPQKAALEEDEEMRVSLSITGALYIIGWLHKACYIKDTVRNQCAASVRGCVIHLDFICCSNQKWRTIIKEKKYIFLYNDFSREMQ